MNRKVKRWWGISQPIVLFLLLSSTGFPEVGGGWVSNIVDSKEEERKELGRG